MKDGKMLIEKETMLNQCGTVNKDSTKPISIIPLFFPSDL